MFIVIFENRRDSEHWRNHTLQFACIGKSLQNNSVQFITGIGSLSPLLGVKIVHLVDRTDLFKFNNLAYDGREIARRLYSSL